MATADGRGAGPGPAPEPVVFRVHRHAQGEDAQALRPQEPETGDQPFHVYSMRQAIEEGFILDVLRNYLTYQTYFRLRKACAEEASQQVDPAQGPLKAGAGRRAAPDVAGAAAQIIVDHFRYTMGSLGGRAEAMVVTRRVTTPSGCTRPSGPTSRARVHRLRHPRGVLRGADPRRDRVHRAEAQRLPRTGAAGTIRLHPGG